ncbi:DNA-binding protein D-ETS-4-like [Ischnura elegans]|uniref:DNA-binding protein D-ETS-4-like n=1 Tax=Ischnura elegans TaxID=197161 RepID=UPI001ED868BE|nr:DNA-binding protein D-ETS-4-like [Ischnura elegans]
MCDLLLPTGGHWETMAQTVPSSTDLQSPDLAYFAADAFDLSLLPPDDDECGLVPSPSAALPALLASCGSPPAFHAPNTTLRQLLLGFEDGDKLAAEGPATDHHQPLALGLPHSPLSIPEDGPPPPLYLSSPPRPSGSSPLHAYSPLTPASTPPAPPSPAAPSPADAANLRRLLQTETTSRQVSCRPEEASAAADPPPQDHRLLREVLQDTSFQRKFNLWPFGLAEVKVEAVEAAEEEAQLDSGGVPAMGNDAPKVEVKTEEDDDAAAAAREEADLEGIEPMLSMAMEQIRRDVQEACKVLGMSPEPSNWSAAEVGSWLRWTLLHFSLPTDAIPDGAFSDLDGAALSTLSEEEFIARAPQSGSTLHAQLEIWKAAAIVKPKEENSMDWSCSSTGDISEEEEEAGVSQASPQTDGSPSTGTSRSGSHIHLWQFLKELLAQGNSYGACIRWLDRSRGVFKIEDSVRVARLWGRRKNRPAMNYDKLSRSIRQYYKKGIMRKTERSQRLVYQFCHPYCL